MGRCNWITEDFIDKELYAPFVIDKDCRYKDELEAKYTFLVEKAKKCSADEESITILEESTKAVLTAISDYYDGDIASAQSRINKIVQDCMEETLAIDKLFRINSYTINQDKQSVNGIPFFRARVSDRITDYSVREMVSLPKNMRSKSGNYRFSISGLPCLYLSNTSYGCWLETGRPAEYEFNVSPFLLETDLKLLNLTVMLRDLSRLDELNENTVHRWLKLIVLMIATSYVVKEENRSFKSEYIVSQLIMLSCKKLGLDGVAYYSKRVSDEIFGRCAINVALLAPYDHGNFSSIYKRIYVKSSSNYLWFKQIVNPNLTHNKISINYETHGWITNLGSYEIQDSYKNTWFNKFDEYLLKSWETRKVASSFLEDE